MPDYIRIRTRAPFAGSGIPAVSPLLPISPSPPLFVRCYNNCREGDARVEITVVTDRDSLAGLRDEWNDLAERCPTSTVYQTWEWNEAWWRAFGRGKRLFVLLARDRNKLLGIAPFYISRHLNTPLRRLAFLGTGVTDYLDFL